MIARCRILGLVLLALAAQSAAAQSTADAGQSFDPRTGRFTAGLTAEARRDPDTLAVPVAKAWESLAVVYRELGIPLSVVDSSTKVLGAMRVTQRRPVGGERLSRLLECGTGAHGPNAERYTVKLTAMSRLTALPDGRTLLETVVGGSAAPNGLSTTVACASTGYLEDRLAADLRKTLLPSS